MLLGLASLHLLAYCEMRPQVHVFMEACSGLFSGSLEVNLILSLLFCLVNRVGWKEDSRASDFPDF